MMPTDRRQRNDKSKGGLSLMESHFATCGMMLDPLASSSLMQLTRQRYQPPRSSAHILDAFLCGECALRAVITHPPYLWTTAHQTFRYRQQQYGSDFKITAVVPDFSGIRPFGHLLFPPCRRPSR
jgi:hypothetical protein